MKCRDASPPNDFYSTYANRRGYLPRDYWNAAREEYWQLRFDRECGYRERRMALRRARRMIVLALLRVKGVRAAASRIGFELLRP